MNRATLLISLLSLGIGAAVGQVGSIVSGAYASAQPVEEESEFQGSQSVKVLRQRVFVPPEYGNLFAITSRPNGATLWFVKDDVIRNVNVGTADVIVERSGHLK